MSPSPLVSRSLPWFISTSLRLSVAFERRQEKLGMPRFRALFQFPCAPLFSSAATPSFEPVFLLSSSRHKLKHTILLSTVKRENGGGRQGRRTAQKDAILERPSRPSKATKEGPDPPLESAASLAFLFFYVVL